MNLEIKTNNRNEVLKRNEVVAETGEKATPSRGALREKLSAMLNAPQERIVINKIITSFGKKKVEIYAKIYDTSEQLKKIEQKHMLKRNFKEEAKKEEAKEKRAGERKEEAGQAA